MSPRWNTARERFWANVQPGESQEDCWHWKGALIPAGYGRLHADGKDQMAHRFAYELLVGPIPEGLVIDHLCRNRACVNPDHLEPVTHRENLLRGVGASALAARQTHCVNGHLLAGDNIWVSSRGHRHCRVCDRERHQRRRELTNPVDRRVKLTPEQRDEIRWRYDSGEVTQAALGAEFGVHQMTVSRVVLVQDALCFQRRSGYSNDHRRVA